MLKIICVLTILGRSEAGLWDNIREPWLSSQYQSAWGGGALHQSSSQRLLPTGCLWRRRIKDKWMKKCFCKGILCFIVYVCEVAHTHFKASIYKANEGAGDIKTSLNLGDGALHIGSSKSFAKKCKSQRGQEELENTQSSDLKHIRPSWVILRTFFKDGFELWPVVRWLIGRLSSERIELLMVMNGFWMRGFPIQRITRRDYNIHRC